MKRFFLLIAILFLLFISCSNPALKNDGIYAKINTSMGSIYCRLFYDKAPVTVGNFIGLTEGTKEYTDPKTKQKIKAPFYNGLIFHRVIKNFVIQGGCPVGNGTGTPGYSFVDEFDESLKHDSAGILSMANSGPNTNGSQFFITLAPQPHLDGVHTIFGKVVSGMDVLMKIGDVEVEKDTNKPYKDVFIKNIKIIRVGKNAKAFDAQKAFSLNEEKLKKYYEERERKAKLILKNLGIEEEKLLKTENGIKYLIRKRGYGKKPKAGNTIIANLEGYLETGEKILSSSQSDKPIEAQVGVQGMLPGLDEMISSMQEGEKRFAIIPYYLAFGEIGKPPYIPEKATILFDIELLRVVQK